MSGWIYLLGYFHVGVVVDINISGRAATFSPACLTNKLFLLKKYPKYWAQNVIADCEPEENVYKKSVKRKHHYCLSHCNHK